MILRRNLQSAGAEDVYSLELRGDHDELLSHAGMTVRDTRFGGGYIRSLTFGGVGTEPENRRGGYVRRIFEEIHKDADSYGAAVALLHPFSFAFYRKLGYERVADKIQAVCPLSALDFIPRYPDLVPYRDDMLEGLIAFYERFSAGRNTMFRRTDDTLFSDRYRYYFRQNSAPVKTYVLYHGNEVRGYVIYVPEKHYDGINRNISDTLYVCEIGFSDRQALLEVLGFLRMYDGELDSVTFHDLSPVPEIDLTLHHYMHTSYRLIPDLSARMLDTDAMLRAVQYPNECGHFTVVVEDDLPRVGGCWQVEYGAGTCEIQRVVGEQNADIRLPSASFVKLLYGTDNFTSTTVQYLEGVSVMGDISDFLRAFPKRINGSFEFF